MLLAVLSMRSMMVSVCLQGHLTRPLASCAESRHLLHLLDPLQWPGHLSPAVRQLLHARRLGTAELQAAGFNADGEARGRGPNCGLLGDLQARHICHPLDLLPHLTMRLNPRAPAGHSMDPLADLQAWQVERLTGCRVRDLSLYRAAFTHKSALPPELRVAQVSGKVLQVDAVGCWAACISSAGLPRLPLR